MNNGLVDEILGLDKHIMSKIMNHYDSEIRRKGLIKEINDGAVIIIQRNQNKELVSYIEFIENENNVIYVASLQILNGFIYRSFIKNIYNYLKYHFKKKMISSVHINNFKSISFHNKFGFYTEELDEKIIFKIETDRVIKKLQKMI